MNRQCSPYSVLLHSSVQVDFPHISWLSRFQFQLIYKRTNSETWQHLSTKYGLLTLMGRNNQKVDPHRMRSDNNQTRYKFDTSTACPLPTLSRTNQCPSFLQQSQTNSWCVCFFCTLRIHAAAYIKIQQSSSRHRLYCMELWHHFSNRRCHNSALSPSSYLD